MARFSSADRIGLADPVNVPGTGLEYPNWQRKLTWQLEDIFAASQSTRLCATLTRARASEPS